MVKPLFDTNILIDYLNAVPQAAQEFDRYDTAAISIITWMEVLAGARPDVADATRRFLAGFQIISLEASVAERAVEIRQEYRIKLPDAIIWATADTNSMLLVTRNSKGFPTDTPGVRIPYAL
ncbi:twitching motility protein PilT [Rhizobium sp. AC44/96]|jgi:predicted nucleic acid-binding protein|uniref:type II toxin-antitoxin system VapC family toxin n=1 Tax=unclassified Rhizobium TaxID=2613769 RepID=UPI00080FD468|nr:MULTISPECIES: type II toxin-antitoxin system VapC family toxin [unclassified Rhizobium]MDM9623616.1 type II toxin-antitoxin system VapC family toxin [Rhizobium sp. S96]OCJ17968.1 twitching motility protein PilT [Rhizobium sp. AC44/96]